MSKKHVTKAIYFQALEIYEQVESTMKSDLSWDMKYDLIFSQNIAWLKENIGLTNSKNNTSFENDVQSFYQNFSQAMLNLEVIKENREEPELLYNF